MQKYKQKILELKSQGFSYTQIAKKLGCSKGTISYHLGEGQKEKTLNRTRKRRNIKTTKQYLINKIENFLNRKYKKKSKIVKSKVQKLLYNKVLFFKKRGLKMNNENYTITEIIKKIGENPKCYLTGKSIDLNKPRTYQLDHIIPSSRGGDNSLDNLQITTKEANQSKRDLTVEEFIQLCKDVLNNFGYTISERGK